MSHIEKIVTGKLENEIKNTHYIGIVQKIVTARKTN